MSIFGMKSKKNTLKKNAIPKESPQNSLGGKYNTLTQKLSSLKDIPLEKNNCPICQEEWEVLADTKELECHSCGNTFHLQWVLKETKFVTSRKSRKEV